MKPNFQKKHSQPGVFARWNFVAYFFRDETDNRLKIGVMLVETRTLSRIFALPENTYYRGSIAWKNDDKSFYYVTINGSQNSLWLQSLDNNNPPQLVGNLAVTKFRISRSRPMKIASLSFVADFFTRRS